MKTDLEAIYYSNQVPTSYAALSFLGLVFDKIYFPGVYLPSEGFDEKETIKEIERIASFGIKRIDDQQLLNCMVFALQLKHLTDFCIFTGNPNDAFGTMEDGTAEMAKALEELIFGPPPPNFYPTITNGFCKELPGGNAVVRAPAWITYPANALLYSSKTKIPLVNDDPTLPVPALGKAAFKNNSKLLSTILTIESVKLVLPEMPILMPEQLAEFRYETKDLLRPFRISMLSLSKELNLMLTSDMTMEDVVQGAGFIAETDIFPRLEELKAFISNPSRPWYRRAVDVVKATPELVSSFFTLPTDIVVAKVLAKFVEVLADLNDEKMDKDGRMKRSGFYYLLRMSDRLGRK